MCVYIFTYSRLQKTCPLRILILDFVSQVQNSKNKIKHKNLKGTLFSQSAVYIGLLYIHVYIY
jgi:hypothetical protein